MVFLGFILLCCYQALLGYNRLRILRIKAKIETEVLCILHSLPIASTGSILDAFHAG